MATTQIDYGTSNQSITITLDNLGSTSLRQSGAIDNSSSKFLDVLVAGKIKTNSSGTSATGYLNIYAYGSANGGTTYSGDASGSDAAFSSRKNNLRFIGAFEAVANSTTYNFGPFSIASVFGCMPDHWGIVIENLTGAALDNAGGTHAVFYQGVKSETV